MKSAIVLCFANALATTTVSVEAMVNENEVMEVGALDLAPTLEHQMEVEDGVLDAVIQDLVVLEVEAPVILQEEDLQEVDLEEVLVLCLEGDFEDTCVDVEWEGVLQEYPWCGPLAAAETHNNANGRVACLAMAEHQDGCQPKCVDYAGGTNTFIAGLTMSGDASVKSYQVSERVYTNLEGDANSVPTEECADFLVDIGGLGTGCSAFSEVAHPMRAFQDYLERHDPSYNELRCRGTDFATFKNENTSIYECTKANPCPVSLRHNEPLNDPDDHTLPQLDDPFSLIGCGKCISVLSENPDSSETEVFHGVVVTYHTFEDSFVVPEENAAIRDLVFLHDEATGPWSVLDDNAYPPVSNVPYYFKVYDCGRKSAGCAGNSDVDFSICAGVTAEGSACTESAPCGISVEEGLHACGQDLVRDGKYYRVTQTHERTRAYWTPEFFVDASVWSEVLGQTECSSILSGPATEADVYFVDFTDIAEHQPTTTTSSTQGPGSASGVAIGVAALVALTM